MKRPKPKKFAPLESEIQELKAVTGTDKNNRLGKLLAELVMENPEAEFLFYITNLMEHGTLTQKEIQRHNFPSQQDFEWEERLAQKKPKYFNKYRIKITTYNDMMDRLFEMFEEWLDGKGLSHLLE